MVSRRIFSPRKANPKVSGTGLPPPAGGCTLVDVTALLSIGEFATVTHLSVKTLRHYHEAELLAPEHVDAHSGYRYYSTTRSRRPRSSGASATSTCRSATSPACSPPTSTNAPP